ncbi:hypothetical protein [Pseudomonas kitaguniensis]|uniref:hypothetical protein n=1 Tax=Pseudomonas kitaguniensis TaxID=2607908 RepID=UPI00156206E2|nr:hypothetical protein [Pseudomonas kitaguniensis]
MYIATPGLAETRNTSTQADAFGAINRAADISFFNAQLGNPEQPGKGVAPAMASPPVSWGSTESDTLSRRVSKGFRDSSQNKNTKDANEFAQSLAEAHIDIMSRVKVISALTKGIDKISSMG